MYCSKIFRFALILLLVKFIVSRGSKISNEIEPNDFAEDIDETQTIFKEYQTKEHKAKSFDRRLLSPEARHQLPLYSAHNPLKLDAKTISEMVPENMSFSIQQRREGSIEFEQCVDNRSVVCNPDSRYRNIDGSCNNLQKPYCGVTLSRIERFATPNYADGIDTPPTGCKGRLPEPREVSLRIHYSPNTNRQSQIGTILFMEFGQWIDHDGGLITQLQTSSQKFIIECCPEKPDIDPVCLPIKIPKNDPVFRTTCMNFVRSVPYPGYSFGWRDQMNAVTSTLDLSTVYGFIDELATFLRTLDGTGQLRSNISKNVELLPSNPDQATTRTNPDYPAFLAGDIRVNQQPLLTALHTIFLRFHNYIAKVIQYLNPHWDDEKIYQEARRIAIASHQRITYNEYAPTLLNNYYVKKYDLLDESTKYNNKGYPRVWSEFQTAAFRLHTQVSNALVLVSESGKIRVEPFADHFFNTRLMHEGELDNIIRGASLQRHEEFDSILADSLTTFLYTENVTVLGMDLASININRGRDHGMPGYTYYAEKVYRKKINNFEDLRRILRQDCLNELVKLYDCVSDIDLFTGLFCEVPCGDALVGCTAAEIIAKQFHDWKYYDRYFYTHINEAGSFTRDQMKTIKNINLATIICYTTGIREIKKCPLKSQSPIIKCSKIKPLNFLPWKEVNGK